MPDWLGFALAGIGLALSFIGLGAVAGAAATAAVAAGGWGALGGVSKALFAIVVAAAGFDLSATVATVIDEYGPDFMDDTTSTILGGTAAGCLDDALESACVKIGKRACKHRVARVAAQ